MEYQYRILSWPSMQILFTSIIVPYSGNIDYNPPRQGFYVIQFRSNNSCGWSDWLFEAELEYRSCFENESPEKQNIYTIYPIPSNDKVNIALRDQNNTLKKGTSISGELFDLMGQSRTKVKIINNKASFSVQGLNKGVYILKINIDGNIESHQIIVK